MTGWRDIPGNEHVFNHLSDRLRDGQAISFIGAGASAGMYPLWGALITLLAEKAKERGRASEDDRASWLKQRDTYPDQVVRGIKAALGNGIYTDVLRQIFGVKAGPDGNRFTPIHAALLRLTFRAHITTNFDPGLLMARRTLRPDLLGAGYATWKDADAVARWQNGAIFAEDPCPTLFAHGSWEKSDSIVLGMGEYREVYRPGAFRRLFEHLWTTEHLVFIGFSFADNWVKFIANEVLTTSGKRTTEPRHIALIGLPDDERYAPFLRDLFTDQYDAEPLFYPVAKHPDGSPDHSALLAVLTELGVGPTPARTGSGPGGITAALGDPAEQARKWLAELKVPLAPESLDLYIQSGVPEVVANLLGAGLSPDTLLNGVPPLELALRLCGDRTGAPPAVRTDVLRIVVRAGPRDVAQAAHDALAQSARNRLIALLRAGVEVEARDDTGQSLAARAMRRDDDSYGDAASDWTDLLIREARKPSPAFGAWILLWAASTGRVHLVEQLLAAEVPVNANLLGIVPSEPIRDSEVGFWWPGGTSLHRLLARAERPYAMMYTEADVYSLDMLRMLLRHGASIDAVDGIGRTPLHIAAKEGLEDAATEFIGRSEIDLARRDAEGETVLDSALHSPRSGGIARKLLARGLPHDPADQARILHRAAYNRDLDFLQDVLDAGVDSKAVSGDVPGALMELAHNWNSLIPTDRRSCVPCLTLLLERDADVSLQDKYGWTALHFLVQGQEVDAVELLLAKGIDPDAASKKGRTALMNCKSVAMAERLLAAGAQQSKCDDYGFNALDHAIIYGRTEVATSLRASDHAPSRKARLIRAIIERNEAVVVEMLGAGVPLDTVDPVGSPLLHMAANVLSPKMLDLLLDHGAAIDARDAQGGTALNECLDSFNGSNEDYEGCVTLLLDRGATLESVNALDNRGEAAIFRGSRLWHVPSIAARLLSAGRGARRRDGTTVLMTAVERGSTDQVAYLLRAGVDPRTVDSHGRTALHYAARYGGDEMESRDKASYLLRAGTGLDVPDNYGETPLIAAVASANHNMVDFLLDQGADQKRNNAVGENLLRIAMRIRDVKLINRFVA